MITYSALLSVLVGCGQWVLAEGVFEDALTEGVLVFTMDLDRCVIDLHELCSAVAKLAVCHVMRQVGELAMCRVFSQVSEVGEAYLWLYRERIWFCRWSRGG